MKVRDILETKAKGFEGIGPDNSIREAMDKISDKKIGALIVMKENSPVGIISERDIFRLMAAKGESAFSNPVKDFMSENLVVCVPDDSIDTAMACMTNNRFRHLPIVEDKKVVGIISIGDIVKAQVDNLKVENHYLKDYIAGKYPA
jgi:CBS domain-containing protein